MSSVQSEQLFRRSAYREYVYALLVVALNIGVLEIIRGMHLPSPAILVVPGVLIAGLAWGLRPALLAALVASITYGGLAASLFAGPGRVESVHIAEVVLITFLVATLAGRFRERRAEIERKGLIQTSLRQLSHKLASASGLDDVAESSVLTVRRLLGADSSILLCDENGMVEVRATVPGFEVGEAGLDFARSQIEQEESVGPTGVAPFGDLLFAPIRGVGQIIGFVVLSISSLTRFPSSTDRDAIVAALSVAIGAAVEREVLARKNVEADVWRRHEELYSALLSSISHDFRTPLSAILGAVETLSISGDILTRDAREDMLDMIREEAERLNRYVSNLLDMTRLESGRLNPNIEPVDVADMVGTAVNRMHRLLDDFDVSINIPPGLNLVAADFILMEHVLANLLENAVKYSEPGGIIGINAARRDDVVEIELTDEGRGIPEDDLARVFDKFYRVRKRDSTSAGTGLGLSICRGIVEAHGGSIRAESPVQDGRGTRIVVALPLAEALEPMGSDSKR